MKSWHRLLDLVQTTSGYNEIRLLQNYFGVPRRFAITGFDCTSLVIRKGGDMLAQLRNFMATRAVPTAT